MLLIIAVKRYNQVMFKSRKSILIISVSILLFIFFSIFGYNFFHEGVSFKGSLFVAMMFTVPLGVISLPSGLLLMSTGDAMKAYEDKKSDDEDRIIFENKISPFYQHKIDE